MLFVFMCVKESSSPVIVCCFLPDVLLNNVQAHTHTHTFPSFSIWLVLLRSEVSGKRWGVSDKIQRTGK